jgi:hypothetical protein
MPEPPDIEGRPGTVNIWSLRSRIRSRPSRDGIHTSNELRIHKFAVAHDRRSGHDVSDPARERDLAGIEIIPTPIMSWPFGKACYYAGAHTASCDTQPAGAECTLTRSNPGSPGGVIPGSL